ncbi:MAG: hypothetical protein DGJ47_001164 [Rickettsiaceae bacterium]
MAESDNDKVVHTEQEKFDQFADTNESGRKKLKAD